jgi:hypothetical protein
VDAHRRLPALGPGLLKPIALTAALVAAALPASVLVAGAATPPPQTVSPWSTPVALSSCGSLAGLRVLFPDDKPDSPTGPGAVVWSAGASCRGGAGARVAAIGMGDQPGAPASPRSRTDRPLAPLGLLSAAAAPHGQLVIAGAGHQRSEGLLVQGTADGSFTALSDAPATAGPKASTTAYLGDVALASATGARSQSSVRLQIERYFAHTFGPATTVPATGDLPIGALTVAMDFRTDALLAWTQGGAIYARDVPASGVHHPLQRIAPAGSHPRLVALLSDDNRGILMWIQQHGSQTSIYMDYSSTGVRFGAPRLLERFEDPDGLPPPAGALQLIRLSSESVMAAWAGASAGHWVLRTAPIDQRGLQQVSTISNPSGDALLSALAPGPKGEAIVLWSQPQATNTGKADLGEQTLLAARGIDAAPGKTIFGAPEQVAAPSPVTNATLALDPGSDRAVAVWQGLGGSIDYSIRSADPTG